MFLSNARRYAHLSSSLTRPLPSWTSGQSDHGARLPVQVSNDSSLSLPQAARTDINYQSHKSSVPIATARPCSCSSASLSTFTFTFTFPFCVLSSIMFGLLFALLPILSVAAHTGMYNGSAGSAFVSNTFPCIQAPLSDWHAKTS